jgi:hypothetical protein
VTSQTKHFIELSDIVGIQLECKNPKCSVSLLASGGSIETVSSQGDMTLSRCPTCNHPWTVPSSYPTQMGYDAEIKKLLRMMETIRSIEDKLGCLLRFEIKGDAILARASSVEG